MLKGTKYYLNFPRSWFKFASWCIKSVNSLQERLKASIYCMFCTLGYTSRSTEEVLISAVWMESICIVRFCKA